MPLFQRDKNFKLNPVIEQVLHSLPTEGMSEWEVALWWTAGNIWLEGKTPSLF